MIASFVLFTALLSMASAQEATPTAAPEYKFNKDFAFNLHSNLGDQIANWNNAATDPTDSPTGSAFEVEATADASPLVRLKGFLGSLAMPVLVGAFTLLSLYLLAQFALQFFGFAYASKSTLFNSLNEWFVSTAFFEKFFSTYIDVDEHETLDGRSARNLNTQYADRIVNMIKRTLETIEAAKAKYED